jgi:hypothetical protein
MTRNPKIKISLNIIATNKYLLFLPQLLKSIEEFFFTEHEIFVLVHTNGNIDAIGSNLENICIIKNDISHEDWPFTTLKRFHYFTQAEKIIEKSNFSFYIDVDSLFIGNIGFSDINEKGIFATIHPGLNQGPGTPERNPNSEAYIPIGSTNKYFCGGFFGGDSGSFLKMSEAIKKAINRDLKKNIIAIWHDESHLNKFLMLNEPAKIFNYPFAVAENLTPIFDTSKILFLDKNSKGGHEFFRS